jgi:hypothetical protein
MLTARSEIALHLNVYNAKGANSFKPGQRPREKFRSRALQARIKEGFLE